MSLETNVVRNPQLVEYGKFVEIQNDSRFPAISVIRTQNRDQSAAFNNPTGQPAFSAVDIYPKYAVLTYDVSSAIANSSIFGDNASTDAFGRLRVSEPDTLIDSKLINNKSPTLFDEVVYGTATSTHSAFDASVYMRTFANNDYVIRQSRQRFNYQPGKSIQAMFTGTFGTETNITKRVGLFDGSFTAPYEPIDGIYLENKSGRITINVIKTQGTVSTESVPQSAWNVDKLDGTGPSGITLNLSKTNIFIIDYEWLGAGRVRAGFVIDGKVYYTHYFNNANVLNAVYMTSPNHNIRYEIRQTEAGSGEMQQICCSVMTEGGEDDVGTPISIDSGGVPSGNYNTTLRPLLGIRKNMNFRNCVIALKQLDILSTTTTNAQFGIYLNPTIEGGTLSFSNSANAIEYAYGNTSLTMTGGTLMYQGLIAKDKAAGSIEVSDKCYTLGNSISGKPDEFIVGLKTFTGNGSFAAIANLLERA